MKKTNFLWVLSTAAALMIAGAMQGCSTSDTNDSDIPAAGDELPAQADAATDAVPPANNDSADLDKVAADTPPADGTTSLDEATPPADGSTPPSATADATTTPPPADGSNPPPAMAQNTPPPSTPPDNVTPPANPPAAESAPAPEKVAKEDTSSSSSSESSGDNGDGSYTVQRGDTLMKIAFEQYGDLYKWKDLYEANRDKIQSPNNIPTGTVLKLDKSLAANKPSHDGERYLIKQGDTLGTISKEVYGTTNKWKKLWQQNRDLIKDPNRIFAGFYLYYTMDGSEDQVKQRPITKAAPAEDTTRSPASASAAVPGAPSDSAAPPTSAPPAVAGG